MFSNQTLSQNPKTGLNFSIISRLISSFADPFPLNSKTPRQSLEQKCKLLDESTFFSARVFASVGPSIMGALTSNRKRGDDYYKSLVSFSTPIDQSYGHITKKPKLSVSMNQKTPNYNRPTTSNSFVSRISQYPDRKSGFSREVHAPIRNSRFGLFSSAKNIEATASSRESSADKMGNFSGVFRQLKKRYETAKDTAMGSLRYGSFGKRKEKEVIEIDSEDENRDDVSDDSSIKEVEIVDSVGNKWKGGQGAVKKSKELNISTVEKEVRSFDSSVVSDVSNAIAKVDDGEKTGLLLSDQVPDDSGVPSYMRLYDWSKKRDGKLANIKFDIELNEKRIQGLHLLRPQKKEELIKKVRFILLFWNCCTFCNFIFSHVSLSAMTSLSYDNWVAFICRMWPRNVLCL